MIVIIDGTGPSDDKEYAKEMGNSFPSQIAKQVVGSTYFRGPSLTGSEVSQIADRAVGAAQGSGPIMLVGYSRGGCTAIITAKRLKAQGKRVKAMFLFDAVDMQTSELGLSQTIPDNVDFVAHARTARSLGFWIRNPVKSRFYFYNTGRWLDGHGILEEKKFTGTHGAAGGVPWADVVGDRACALAVAEWMNGQLKSQGVNATLKA
ncbi:thioesterase domain-containing protein [Caulobacter sp. RL271]|jgi:pimeloyl-ACP methyl ester carboxylesterase|uniref:Thioesterase domain-containing protein n=1 Tax=Caulobacter segnis TaxID=88688 RepID=A0ABY4ZN20_9CAUL|nr:thioesterase domain-containing protein [Caulobacter segnis]USQ93971.1 thioesterase domain-containing protein [Caulobacter segnis]